jgi:hypothetical protein
VPLTAAPLAPADGVPVTPVVCDPSPAVGVIGTMPEALLSPQPDVIAAIHRVAIPNTYALFIARPWPLVWRLRRRLRRHSQYDRGFTWQTLVQKQTLSNLFHWLV